MIQKTPMDALGRLSVKAFREMEKTPIRVVLDNVRSMHNVGSIFRTCDAFAVKKIYLCGITPTPPHREIHKTALGSEDAVSWEYNQNTSDLIRRLNDEGCLTVAVEQTNQSRSLQNFVFENTFEIALVFGNEVNGVADEVLQLCQMALEIPQWGTKHSLNISVAAGIVLWHLTAQVLRSNV